MRKIRDDVRGVSRNGGEKKGEEERRREGRRGQKGRNAN